MPNSQAIVNKHGCIVTHIPEGQKKQVGLKSMSMKQLTANHIFKTVKDAIEPHLINDISNIVMGYVGVSRVKKAVAKCYTRESLFVKFSHVNMQRFTSYGDMYYQKIQPTLDLLAKIGGFDTPRGKQIKLMTAGYYENDKINWNQGCVLDRCTHCGSSDIKYVHLLIEQQLLNYLNLGLCQSCSMLADDWNC
jgi:hypothetical protein